MEYTIEILKIIISWPLAVFILGLFFIFTFKSPISDFFRRIVRGEAYGVRIEASAPTEQQKAVGETQKYPSKDEIEKYVAENPTQVIRDYLRLSNGYHFERAYNLIYGTQLDVLEDLEKKGSEGEKYINLINFYNEFQRRSNLQSTQYADYLGFLGSMKFIEYKGSDTDLTVHITPFGVNFLSYIRGQYSNAYKYRAY